MEFANILSSVVKSGAIKIPTKAQDYLRSAISPPTVVPAAGEAKPAAPADPGAQDKFPKLGSFSTYVAKYKYAAIAVVALVALIVWKSKKRKG